MNSESQNYGTAQGMSRLGTAPVDELLHCDFVVPPERRGAETENCRFRVIKIRSRKTLSRQGGFLFFPRISTASMLTSFCPQRPHRIDRCRTQCRNHSC